MVIPRWSRGETTTPFPLIYIHTYLHMANNKPPRMSWLLLQPREWLSVAFNTSKLRGICIRRVRSRVDQRGIYVALVNKTERACDYYRYDNRTKWWVQDMPIDTPWRHPENCYRSLMEMAESVVRQRLFIPAAPRHGVPTHLLRYLFPPTNLEKAKERMCSDTFVARRGTAARPCLMVVLFASDGSYEQATPHGEDDNVIVAVQAQPSGATSVIVQGMRRFFRDDIMSPVDSPGMCSIRDTLNCSVIHLARHRRKPRAPVTEEAQLPWPQMQELLDETCKVQ